MRLSLAAARKYALIICMRLLAVISMHLLTILYYTCYFLNLSLSEDEAVCLQESVTISARPTACKVLQLTREDRNDDRFAACLQV